MEKKICIRCDECSKEFARLTRELKIKESTPKWADLKAIEEFRKACPPDHNVIFKIPLGNSINKVSGLNVLSNLAYSHKSMNTHWKQQRTQYPIIGYDLP